MLGLDVGDLILRCQSHSSPPRCPRTSRHSLCSGSNLFSFPSFFFYKDALFLVICFEVVVVVELWTARFGRGVLLSEYRGARQPLDLCGNPLLDARGKLSTDQVFAAVSHKFC